jgi:prepilin-type processing-associated H-X9-DG protein
MQAYLNPGGINAACLTLIKNFQCPSDPTPPMVTAANGVAYPGNNYRGSQGTAFMCDLGDAPGLQSTLAPGLSPNGIFYYQSSVTIAQITDGTSNTAMFSERLRGGGVFNPRTVMLLMPVQTTITGAYQACQSLDPNTAIPMCYDGGVCWAMGEDCCTLYNHVSPPNTNNCGAKGFPGGMTNMAMDSPPSSYHTNGVNIVFCDGSLHFVTNSVSLPTWYALGTRNGGDVPGPDY